MAPLDFWVFVIGIGTYVIFGLIVLTVVIDKQEREPRPLPLRTDKTSPFAKATPPPRRTIKRRPRQKKKGAKK